MRQFLFIFYLLLCSSFAAQQTEVSSPRFEIRRDAYGDIYVYDRLKFDFTKFDRFGKQLGRQLFTVPHQILSVRNPLNVVVYSVDAQKITFLDSYLTQIQSISVQDFGWITDISLVDGQLCWLADMSSQTLKLLNYREGKIVKSILLPGNVGVVKDMAVLDDSLLLLTAEALYQYSPAIGWQNKVTQKHENVFLRIVESGSRSVYVEDVVGTYYLLQDEGLVGTPIQDTAVQFFDGTQYWYQQDGRWLPVSEEKAATDMAPDFRITR